MEEKNHCHNFYEITKKNVDFFLTFKYNIYILVNAEKMNSSVGKVLSKAHVIKAVFFTCPHFR